MFELGVKREIHGCIWVVLAVAVFCGGAFLLLLLLVGLVRVTVVAVVAVVAFLPAFLPLLWVVSAGRAPLLVGFLVLGYECTEESREFALF